MLVHPKTTQLLMTVAAAGLLLAGCGKKAADDGTATGGEPAAAQNENPATPTEPAPTPAPAEGEQPKPAEAPEATPATAQPAPTATAEPTPAPAPVEAPAAPVEAAPAGEPTPTAAVEEPKSDTPPPAPGSLEELCGKAMDHVVELADKEGAPLAILERMKGGEERAKAIAECKTEPRERIECVLNAADGEALMKCSTVGEEAAPADGPAPDGLPTVDAPADPAMAGLCEKAYDHLMSLLEKEELPEEVRNRMKTPEERAKMVEACAKEPRAAIECMLKAETMEAVAKCDQPDAPADAPAVGPGAAAPNPNANPELQELCTKAFTHVLDIMGKDPSVPQEALAMMRNPAILQKAVADCTTKPRPEIECMLAAKAPADLSKCTSPAGQPAPAEAAPAPAAPAPAPAEPAPAAAPEPPAAPAPAPAPAE